MTSNIRKKHDMKEKIDKNFEWYIFSLYGVLFSASAIFNIVDVDSLHRPTFFHFITELWFAVIMLFISLIVLLAYLIDDNRLYKYYIRGIAACLMIGMWGMIGAAFIIEPQAPTFIGLMTVPLILEMIHSLWKEPLWNRGDE